jgi:hypothetical protein
MEIRNYQPGDEVAQVEIFNLAVSGLPAFKPANVDEIRRRYASLDPDAGSRFYAIRSGQIVGYAAFNPNGRMSYPWCRPGDEDTQEPLIEALLAEMRRRGFDEAWTTYRADWQSILQDFTEWGFAWSREMINFVTELNRIPCTPEPDGFRISAMTPGDLTVVQELGRGLFVDDSPDALLRFFWENPFFQASSLFALRRIPHGELRGIGLAIVNGRYADPAKIDANMPCFRLGAFGTETERHKRVNGLVSVLFESEPDGESLLSEAGRRLRDAGLVHAAAQAPSDHADLVRFYDRFFQRQGAFPILTRRLTL